MSVSTETLKIVITSEEERATRGLRLVGKELDDISKKTKEASVQSESWLKSAAGGVEKYATAIKAGLAVAALKQVYDGLDGILVRANEISNISRTFSTTGFNADNLSIAANGLANKFDLMAASAKLAGTGVKLSADNMEIMSMQAAALGQRHGQDAAKVIENISHSVKKANTEMLASSGLYIRGEVEIRNYAAALGKNADDLTQVERSQAILNATMREMSSVVGAQEAVVQSAGTKWVDLKNSISSAVDSLILWSSESFAVKHSISLLSESITALSMGMDVADLRAKKVSLSIKAQAQAIDALAASKSDAEKAAESTLLMSSALIETEENSDKVASAMKKISTEVARVATDAAMARAEATSLGSKLTELGRQEQTVIETLSRVNDATSDAFISGQQAKLKAIQDEKSAVVGRLNLAIKENEIITALTGKYEKLAGIQAKKAAAKAGRPASTKDVLILSEPADLLASQTSAIHGGTRSPEDEFNAGLQSTKDMNAARAERLKFAVEEATERKRIAESQATDYERRGEAHIAMNRAMAESNTLLASTYDATRQALEAQIKTSLISGKLNAKAARQMLADTMATVAARNVVAALENTALGVAASFMNPALAASYFAAAKIHAAVAVMAGGVARASATGASSGGGGSDRRESGGTGFRSVGGSQGDTINRQWQINVFTNSVYTDRAEMGAMIMDALNAGASSGRRINPRSMGSSNASASSSQGGA